MVMVIMIMVVIIMIIIQGTFMTYLIITSRKMFQ